MNLKGIFPPLTTPFDSKGNIFLEKLSSNIKKISNYDLRGFLVLGSNGEFPLLSIEEKMGIIEEARKCIPKEKLLLAGTGCQSTRETIDLTIASASTGADAALVLNPFFYKGLMNRGALIEFYQKLADASPIPIIIYNMPANSGIDLDAELIIELSKHPNIVGLKDSGGNLVKMAEILDKVGDDFTLLSGSAGLLLPALSIGASGGILAMANIAPEQCLDIFNYFQNRQMEKAANLQRMIVKINSFVTREHGIPALKVAMDELGLYGGLPRQPLLPLPKDKKVKLFELIKETGLGEL